MKKIAVILVALIGMLYINTAECQPVEQEDVISVKTMELSSWFNRCRNKLSQDQRQEFFFKNDVQKEIFLRLHCMSVKNGGFIVPPNIRVVTDTRELRLKYAVLRSKQGGCLAGGIVFMVVGLGNAIGAYYTYGIYDKAPAKTELKDSSQNSTIIMSVVAGTSIITSFIFFGASHHYRMDANGVKVDLHFAMNGISGTF